ncbi:MAG: pitrilysin family protein [Candidatus Eisenbacteria bacterium]
MTAPRMWNRFVRAAVAVAALCALALPVHAAARPAASAWVRSTLPNGLQVVVVPTSRLPLVDFRLVARAGSVYDPAGREGLARLTSELLTQGAGKRTAQQLADDIEFVGGSLEANSGAEQFVVSGEVLQKDLALGLELFRDVIVSPTFPAEDFERKKAETLGQIASDKSEPSVIAENAMTRWFWGDSPLAHPAVGYDKSLEALTREDVVRFHREHLTPERSVLVVVGDVNAAAFMATLKTAFAGWKKSGVAPGADPYGPAAALRGRQVRIVNKPEATQTQIRMMCPSVPRNHPDWYAIQVANTICGAGFTSRLVNSIRVEKGLTYSIGSGFRQNRSAGAFRITTFTKNETLREIVDAVLAEVQKLVDEGPTDAEYDKSRNFLKGQFPLGLQSPDDLAGEIANAEFFNLPQDFIASYPQHVGAVTKDDVKRVLKSYFCTQDLKILVVTNGELAKKALDGVGALEVKEID